MPRAYLTHLNEPLPEEPLRPVFYAKREELFTDLLYEMGTALGYDFDKTQISKGAYSTVFHATLEAEWETIRKKTLDLLNGKSSLPITNGFPQR